MLGLVSGRSVLNSGTGGVLGPSGQAPGPRDLASLGPRGLGFVHVGVPHVQLLAQDR